MVEWKNEVAGVVAILGFVSLVLAVTGVAGVLDAVFGSGSVVLVTTETTAIQGNVTGTQEGGVLGSALLTAFGVAGLLVTHSAIQSGYFEPGASTEPASSDSESGPEPPSTDAGSEPDSTPTDASSESETDVEPA